MSILIYNEDKIISNKINI